MNLKRYQAYKFEPKKDGEGNIRDFSPSAFKQGDAVGRPVTLLLSHAQSLNEQKHNTQKVYIEVKAGKEKNGKPADEPTGENIDESVEQSESEIK